MKELERQIKELELKINPPIQEQHIFIDWENYSFYLPHNGKRYVASKTGREFHSSCELVRAVVGPVNSGKSTLCTNDLLFTACMMPPYKIDGVRRSRFGVVRNTYSDLRTTTLTSFMEWFDGFGMVPPDRKNNLRMDIPFNYRTIFNDGRGLVDLTIEFISLDTNEKDLKKFDSLNRTSIFFNEARYIGEMAFNRSLQRVKRYPDPGDIDGEVIGGVICDTNPCTTKHWFYYKFEELRPEKHKIWHQPPGLIRDEKGKLLINPDAENLDHMPKEYYLDSASGQTEEHINVMLMGNYGYSSDKRAVYPEYNDDLHSVESLEYIKDAPVILGWDFGSTPAVVFGQMTGTGRILLIKEFWVNGGGLKAFLEDTVIPYRNSVLSGHTLMSWVDPAGFSPTDTDASNCVMVLRQYGFSDVRAAPSNKIEPRLEAVRTPLRKLIDGKGALIVSRTGCPMIRGGFVGEYCLREVKTANGIEHKEPLKNDYSHLADTVQYFCLGVGHMPPKKNAEKAYKMLPVGGLV